jgi:hypothetical protein
MRRVKNNIHKGVAAVTRTHTSTEVTRFVSKIDRKNVGTLVVEWCSFLEAELIMF